VRSRCRHPSAPVDYAGPLIDLDGVVDGMAHSVAEVQGSGLLPTIARASSSRSPRDSRPSESQHHAVDLVASGHPAARYLARATSDAAGT
jgi:hypothetical protein